MQVLSSVTNTGTGSSAAGLAATPAAAAAAAVPAVAPGKNRITLAFYGGGVRQPELLLRAQYVRLYYFNSGEVFFS